VTEKKNGWSFEEGFLTSSIEEEIVTGTKRLCPHDDGNREIALSVAYAPSSQ